VLTLSRKLDEFKPLLRGMQFVMATLIRSLPQILNVILFGLFQFVVFGILGVQMFGGKFWWGLADKIVDRS